MQDETLLCIPSALYPCPLLCSGRFRWEGGQQSISNAQSENKKPPNTEGSACALRKPSCRAFNWWFKPEQQGRGSPQPRTIWKFWNKGPRRRRSAAEWSFQLGHSRQNIFLFIILVIQESHICTLTFYDTFYSSHHNFSMQLLHFPLNFHRLTWFVLMVYFSMAVMTSSPVTVLLQKTALVVWDSTHAVTHGGSVG